MAPIDSENSKENEPTDNSGTKNEVRELRPQSDPEEALMTSGNVV